MSVPFDRVGEYTATTGTGSFTVSGAMTGGYLPFSAVPDGTQVTYCCQLRSTGEFEVGRGTKTGTTVTRGATPLASSNAGALVSFSAGSKELFVTWAADDLVVLGPYATTTALQSAKPAASYTGRVALVGSSAPYLPYMSDGSAWVSLFPAGDPYVAVASSGAAQSFNIATAGILDLTLTANCTLSVTGAVNGTAYSARIILRQDGTGSRSVIWPANTKWPYGAAPVLSTPPSSIDEVVLTTFDGGTTFFGDIVAKGRA